MTAAPSSTSEPTPAGPPASAARALIEARDLGVCFRLHGRKPASVRETLLRWRPRRSPPMLWALRGVNFVAREGQALGIVGPNGAGKSTLCLVLARILAPDEGTVTIRGDVSPLLTLGAGFHRDLSGRDNIYLCGAFLGIRRAEMDRRIDEIIEFSQIGDLIDEPIRHFSSGMRARLGFSVATALNPEILVLDEVLAVGDQAFRAKSRQRLQELMAESRLIVIVSHAIGFLRRICTHCLWLDRGRVVRYGPAEDVLAAYEESGRRPPPAPAIGA
jgi:ABC-type polysaccharide/polyol phosphate transport system ATPase subunit